MSMRVIELKVIFLDFDGVINDVRDTSNLVVTEYVSRLKKIVEITGAKIVVSSSRKNEFIGENVIHEETYCYQNYELPLQSLGIEIFDYTPLVNAPLLERKEFEIEAYLKEHPKIEEYVILDDDMVMKKFLEHQVFIEYSNGLLEEHINPAIAILNGRLSFYPPNYNINESLCERTNRILGASPFEEDFSTSEFDRLERTLSKILDFRNWK